MPSEDQPGKRLSDFFNKVSKIVKDAIAGPVEQEAAFEQPAQPVEKKKTVKKPRRWQM